MRPDLRVSAVSATLGFEGRIGWGYRDSSASGWFTCGGGHCCFTQADALLLPWQVNGVPATPQQVIFDYQSVLAAPPGHTAAFYENLTTCRLSATDVAGMCGHDIDVSWTAFLHYYSQADEYPDAAILALADFTFQSGPGWSVLKKNGAPVWPHLAADVAACRWAVMDATGALIGGAAFHCHVIGIAEARNLYRRGL